MERSVPSHQICVIYSSSFLRKKISHETASSVLYCFAICQLLKAGCAYKFRKSRHWLSTRSVFIDWPWMMTDFKRIPSWRGKPAILTQGSFGIANPPPSLSMSSPHWCLRAVPHNLWYANQTPDRSFREKNSVHFSSIPSSSLVLKEKTNLSWVPSRPIFPLLKLPSLIGGAIQQGRRLRWMWLRKSEDTLSEIS